MSDLYELLGEEEFGTTTEDPGGFGGLDALDLLEDDLSFDVTTAEPPPTTTGPPTTTVAPTTTTIDPSPDAGLIVPSNTSLLGCVDPESEVTIIIPSGGGGGGNTIIEWPLVGPDGKPALPTGTVLEPGEDSSNGTTRAALFYDPFSANTKPVFGKIFFAVGKPLRIEVPASVLNRPSIYLLELRWQNLNGVLLRGKGLISIEPSLFLLLSQTGAIYSGPLTLTEVRTRLRDFPRANDLTGTYEFSVEEILYAIIRPIQTWNETSPHTSRYGAANFPWRAAWLDGVCATLYLTAAHWLLRNSVQLQGEGIASDDRGRWKVMFEFASFEWENYKKFVYREKGRQNIRGGFLVI